jgi:hypothetical protein
MRNDDQAQVDVVDYVYPLVQEIDIWIHLQKKRTTPHREP